jgi:alpha-glucosidase (family GH31 glycosyl hydrolase)
MKRNIFLFIIFLLGNLQSAQNYNPVANPEAIVKSDNIRFTVLTPGLIRMEWAEDSNFEDHASLVFVNRELPVPEFSKQEKDGWLKIETNKFVLNYKIHSGKFTNDNLQIEFNIDGSKKVWKPGLENNGNLFGTIRTLDGFDGEIMQWSTKKPIELDHGILSRDGWVLIDDSDRPVFDNSEWPWVMPRPQKEQQDFYFFCYGYDYKTALNDFIKTAGRIALPPKYAFGIWWSRYWEYSDWELRELVEEYEIHDVPLDVLVVDMDWHLTTRPEWYKDGKKMKDQAGEDLGWTGLTWNKNYFPYPKKFLQWTNEKDLKVCMNLHPASGIQSHEEKYPEMAKAMGIDPESNIYVPFDIVNKNFANNFMKIILHPMEADGVDFWWLDWQQWSTTKIQGVNPTFYLNYVFFSDMERRDEKRPLIFHRYGGLGNHRYQIGFSGDTYINWKSLNYQPYFTATASNVGFGFWSHDIGGHMRGESYPELYTRWIQLAAFSPILRTHCTKAGDVGGIERRIWAYPLQYFYAMRNAFHLRKELFPYIYSAAREAYDTGISICRPMYYEYPEAEDAYNYKNQYMFGNDLLIAPITKPIGKDSLFVQKRIWLPEGEWIEWFSGTVLKGGKVVKRTFTLEEIPVYVKNGSIIPMYSREEKRKTTKNNRLVLTVFPGKKGYTKVYDDEGDSNDYKSGEYTFTDIKFEKSDQKKIQIIIKPIVGKYQGMKELRTYEIRLPLTFPPAEVKINDKIIEYHKAKTENSWFYNGDELSTHILTAEFNVHEKIIIEIEFSNEDLKMFSGKIGKINRLITFMKFLAKNNWDKSKYSNDMVVNTAQTGHRLTLNPKNAFSEIQKFDNKWQYIIKDIKECSIEKENYIPYLELLKLTELQ